MQFITFSGVDGSGKSTQLRLLREQLERDGKKVAYFHAIDFSLASQLEKIKNHKSKIINQKNRDTGKSKISASWCGIFLRKISLIIDLIRFRFFFSKLKREGYDYLLSDRYFFDTIVNIEYLESKNMEHGTGNTKKEFHSLFHALCSMLLCRPDKALYFDADPETIMRRERAPEQGIDYLHAKQALFRRRLSEWNMIALDADREKEVIYQEIQKATH